MYTPYTGFLGHHAFSVEFGYGIRSDRNLSGTDDAWRELTYMTLQLVVTVLQLAAPLTLPLEHRSLLTRIYVVGCSEQLSRTDHAKLQAVSYHHRLATYPVVPGGVISKPGGRIHYASNNSTLTIGISYHAATHGAFRVRSRPLLTFTIPLIRLFRVDGCD